MTSRTGPAGALRRLRWSLALGGIVMVASFAGCFDGDDARRPPAGPLPAALSYLDGKSGAVFVIETDLSAGPYRRLDRLGSRFERWRRFKRRLEAEIAKQGLDFGRIVRPQLGYPFALAVTRDGSRVGAIRVKDPAALRRTALERVAAGKAERLDDYKGALVWREKGARGRTLSYSAAQASELVAAQSEHGLEDAIDAADGSESLAFDETFTGALGALGGRLLVRGVGDARRLLENADPGEAAEARKIPWVNALGIFTLAAGVERSGISIDFKLSTARAPLRRDQLPLAPGPAAPRLHDLDAAAAFAVLEPEGLVRFGERALAVSDPGRFARYEAGVTQLRSIFGVDLHKDLLRRITNLSVAVDSLRSATFVASLERGSSRAFGRALDRAQPFVEGVVREIAPGTAVEARGSGRGRVWLVRNRGFTLARYTVRGEALVGSVGRPRLPEPVRGRRLEGAKGALSIKGDPRRIARITELLPGIPQDALEIFSRLGDLTLSVRAETRELLARGRVEAR